MSLVYGVGWIDETKTTINYDKIRDTFFKNGQFRFIAEIDLEGWKEAEDFNFICIEGGCLYNGRCMLKSDAEKTLKNIIAQFFCPLIMFLAFFKSIGQFWLIFLFQLAN